MPGPIVAAGATLSVGASNVGFIKSISGPELSVSLIDITALSDTARKFLASPIPNSGKLSLSVFLDPDDVGAVACRTAVGSGAIVACVLTLSDATTASFNAFVESWKMNVGGVDEALSADIELQISGVITWA